MKKTIFLALFISLVSLFGTITPVFTLAPIDPELSSQSLDDLPLKPDAFRLTGSNVYTLYLPIITNPRTKNGFGAARYSPGCVDLTTLRAFWYHNWSPFPDPNCGSGYNKSFVPMIYNGTSMVWLSTAIANAQASGWLMGFSEPNIDIHGGLTPAEGAVLWKQIEDAVAGTTIKLVSPAPNQWHPGQNGQTYGHQWTWVMVDEYQLRYGSKPRFDALGWNFYADNSTELQSFLIARHNEALARGYDVPFWLFEYAGSCVFGSNASIQATMLAATPWLDTTPWIGRYAWFATRLTLSSDAAGNDYTKCSLIDANSGAITPLGQIYQGF